VTLIDGYDDQFKYIRHADLIITDNGSIGWEGILLGRRVITFTNTFYDGSGLGHRVREPEELAATVVEMLKQPPVKDPTAYDEALGWLLDAEWEASAPLDSADHVEALDLLREHLDSGSMCQPQSQLQAG
jgi:CDP-glycerol glycerophosphotransferase (TagB/SpsB family)